MLLAGAIGLALTPSRADGIEVRVATFNIENGTGDPGSTKYNAIRDELERMDADVVGFQELRTSTFGTWSNLAAELGYSFSAIGDYGPFSGALYNGYFSRYPILSTHSVISPAGAVELTRAPFRVVVDVPDAQSPLVLWNMHHKASSGSIDKFRRAIEANRIAQDMDAYVAANPSHLEYVLLGDMNEDIRDSQTASYASQPSGAPSSYVLGSDITFPVAYATFPNDRYADAGDGLVHMPAYWEGTSTPITRPESSRQLDYIYLSPTLDNSPLGTPQAEIYYSATDTGGGLPKVGTPLAAGTSSNASDHLPVFIDFFMTDISPVLPTAAYAPSGESGGPFDPETCIYTLTETNSFDTLWWVETDVDWLTLSETNFWLSPFTPVEFDVTLNANAELLEPGIYEAGISFWNETIDLEEIRTVSLTIHDYLAISPTNGLAATGNAEGPFTPGSQIYVVTNKSTAAQTFTALSTNNWISVNPSSWTLNAGETVDVTVSLNSNADSLPSGIWADTLIFSNQTTGLTQERTIRLSVIGTICDAVDNCILEWTTGGDAEWYYQNSNTVDGVDAAQSHTINSDQETWMETTVTGPVYLSFDWKVSSEESYDYLELWVDEDQGDRISGETDWEPYSLSLTSGTHVVRWQYRKDSSVTEGEDAAWVDQITLDYLTATPSGTWYATSILGGPVSTNTQSYVVTNSGLDTIQWSVSSNVAWISVRPVSGELLPGESERVVLSLNEQAKTLDSDNHEGSVTFSNTTTGASFLRNVRLSIQDTLIVSPSYMLVEGIVNGPVPATTNVFSISNASPSETSWSLTNRVDWMAVSASTGFLAAGASTNIDITFTTNTYDMPEGYSHTSIIFSNTTTHLTQSRGVYLLLREPLALSSTVSTVEGPAGGPFTPASLVYTITNQSLASQDWTAAVTNSWLSLDVTSGTLAASSSTQVTAHLTSAADGLPSGAYPASLIVSNATSGNILPGAITLSVDIEFCDALDACDFIWTVGGDAHWLYQTSTSHDAVDAAASGSISAYQETWMETTVTGPADLSFEWKVSCKTYYAYLVVIVDNVVSNYITGDVDWQPQTISLTSGTHVVRWRYYKSYSPSTEGEDTAWVDSVTWTPTRTAMGVPVEWYERFGLAPSAGETWDDLDPRLTASGSSYWSQYISGLDPTDPDDIFVVLAIEQTSGQPTRIDWWGGTNGPVQPYVIECTTNLNTGPWGEIGTRERTAGLNSWTSPVPSERMLHYRILATPDP